MTRRRLTALALAAFAVATLTACSSGPLDTKCEDFLTLSQSEQHDIAVAWAKETLKQEDLAQASANAALPQMVAYCQTDPDAKIGELEYSFG